MSPHEIKAKLAIKGFTLKKIADEFDVSAVAVHYVVFNRRRSRRIERRIIAVTGLSGHKLWPENYPRKIKAV